MLEAVDVDLVFRVLDGRGDRLRAQLEPIAAAGDQLILGHPHDRRLELVGGLGRVGGGGDHVAARAVDLVGQRDRHRLAGDRVIDVAILGDDPRDPGLAARRQDPDLGARTHRPRRDLAGETAKILVGTVDPLHRHPQRFRGIVGGAERDAVEMLDQARAAIPGRGGAGRHHIVALQAGDRDRDPVVDADAVGEQPIVGANRLERRLVVVDQVHLGHRQHEVADAEQMREVAVPPGLRQHALARVDHQHGELGGRRAGDHVAGILLVAGRVGDDELALGTREIAIGDVDRDALLALGRQAVDQQREIESVALRADRLAVGFEARELVVEDLPAVVQQPPDQGRLAVVDAAAGDEAQQLHQK